MRLLKNQYLKIFKFFQKKFLKIILKNKYEINKPLLKETYYYYKIFTSFYGKHANIIPHYWMPKWCGGVNDPSARELADYNNVDKK